MDKLISKSLSKVEKVSLYFKRFLMDRINWNRRLIAIKGARGTGKTTLLLQYIKETYGVTDEALYISLDDIYFTENRLVELVDKFTLNGGKYLFVDEVHKYPNWSREIKNIYDDHHDLKVVFTGSSILEIDKAEADLSRRAVVYQLPVLSLREYLAITGKSYLKSYSLQEILNHHTDISAEVTQKIKPIKELKNYNETGAYPFFLEASDEYAEHLERIITVILEEDLPSSVNIDYSSVLKLKQLLWVVSESVPFQPNISKLSLKIGISRDTLIKYISLLEKAGLVKLLHSGSKGISKMSKPDKIFMDNNNLLHALQPGLKNVGTLRETFFFNQLSVSHRVSHPKKGDFIIDNKYIFEIGGKNKTEKQVEGIENAYVVSDDIEYGHKNKIPLWIFGLMY